MDLQLDYYKTLFLSVRTQIVKGKKKVAKPIFLISILDMIEKGKLKSNHITYTSELEQMYNSLFEIFQKPLSPLKYPFYHLITDGFYHIQGSLPTKSPTPKQLRETVEYAYLDDALWELLQDEAVRGELRESLVNHFLR